MAAPKGTRRCPYGLGGGGWEQDAVPTAFGHMERIVMQPFDSDLEYVVYRSDPKSRLNSLYILPGLGAVWLLYLIGAAILQWPVSGVVNTVMGLFIVLFIVMAALLLWAMAPKENR